MSQPLVSRDYVIIYISCDHVIHVHHVIMCITWSRDYVRISRDLCTKKGPKFVL